MGFNNEGVDAAVIRLKNRKTKAIIGGNIGKILKMLKYLNIVKDLIFNIYMSQNVFTFIQVFYSLKHWY